MYDTNQFTGAGLMAAQEKLAALDARPNLRRSLLQQKANAEEHIQRVNETLALLDKNPDIEQILQLLGRSY
jgi:hypothetical protein